MKQAAQLIHECLVVVQPVPHCIEQRMHQLMREGMRSVRVLSISDADLLGGWIVEADAILMLPFFCGDAPHGDPVRHQAVAGWYLHLAPHE